MAAPEQFGVTKPRPIAHLRWWIGAMLFASTVINYIDRQTLSLLAPYLQIQYHWDNTDYANLVVAFRVAYTIGLTVCGRLMDRIGTRRGLTLTVVWYSTVAILTSLARGFYSFATFRFLLGAGESANWPAATKAVSEWFPQRERGLATAFFDSGSSVGGAIAPFLVLWIYFRWGWRPAFMVPGLLGFSWLLVWRWIYYSPKHHPRISQSEREMLIADQGDFGQASAQRERWRDLLSLPQTWATIIARSFTDPVWFFVADWFPIYLVAKGVNLRSSLFAIWIPFIAADLGNFFGGTASGYLIKRGWPLGRARKALVIFGGIGVTLLIPTILTRNLYLIALFFAIATFCYASFSTIANVLPADLYHNESVASVSGISGTGAGIGTIVASELIGRVSDARRFAGTHSFDPIIAVAGIVPLLGMFLVLLLLRNNKATEQGLVRRL